MKKFLAHLIFGFWITATLTAFIYSAVIVGESEMKFWLFVFVFLGSIGLATELLNS